MRWITRSHAMVERIACPWLIRKFVDSDAEFIFVAADKVLEMAEKLDAIPFDVKGAELGHKGDKCTFDAIIERYGLKDRALLELAKIVRGADTKNKDLTPQSRGLVAIAEGFRLISSDDYDNIEKQFPVYDALYAFCSLKVAASKKS
ncbi:chromate resistance protein [Candidatus Bathyarchaeota archaeon ex4484_231]|nr:MAG: chromate resistance protein [Candidatus Bathyarchaeota archaeon ex4484_231]